MNHPNQERQGQSDTLSGLPLPIRSAHQTLAAYSIATGAPAETAIGFRPDNPRSTEPWDHMTSFYEERGQSGAHSDSQTKATGLETLWSTIEYEPPELQEAVRSTMLNPDDQTAAMDLVSIVNRLLVEDGLEPKVKRRAALKIEFVPQEFRADLIHLALSNAEASKRILNAAARMIEFSPADTVAGLVNEFLDDPDVDLVTKRQAAGMIGLSDDIYRSEQVAERFQDVTDSESLSFRSRLHDVADDNGVVEIEKSDGRLHVLPRELEASVRTMDADAFRLWATVYGNSGAWRALGFDYIPVEPILNFAPASDHEVMATTLNLRGNLLSESLFAYSLRVQRNVMQRYRLIRGAVRSMGVDPVHDHGENFVLVPMKSAEGKPDRDQDPHIHLIDFDIAQPT